MYSSIQLWLNLWKEKATFGENPIQTIVFSYEDPIAMFLTFLIVANNKKKSVTKAIVLSKFNHLFSVPEHSRTGATPGGVRSDYKSLINTGFAIFLSTGFKAIIIFSTPLKGGG